MGVKADGDIEKALSASLPKRAFLYSKERDHGVPNLNSMIMGWGGRGGIENKRNRELIACPFWLVKAVWRAARDFDLIQKIKLTTTYSIDT